MLVGGLIKQNGFHSYYSAAYKIALDPAHADIFCLFPTACDACSYDAGSNTGCACLEVVLINYYTEKLELGLEYLWTSSSRVT